MHMHFVPQRIQLDPLSVFPGNLVLQVAFAGAVGDIFMLCMDIKEKQVERLVCK